MINFVRGLKAKYDSSTQEDNLYFATDSLELLLNGKSYGGGILSDAVFENGVLTLTFLSGEVTEVSFPTATESTVGLMNISDKTKLSQLDYTKYITQLTRSYNADTGFTIHGWNQNNVEKTSCIIPMATTDASGVMSKEDKTNLDACVETKLSSSEKAWVEEQLFNTLFTATISASPSSSVFEGKDITVTYTLTTKYDGNNVDLDSIPSGWTKSSTGVYTKTGVITSSTGSSINSGNATCTYNERSKTANAASSNNIKYSYILTSTASSLTTSDLDTIATNGTQISTSNTISGDKTINITTDKSYVYFVISNTSTLKNVQQLGLDYLEDKVGTSLTRTDYGTYKIYRSANSMSVGTQTVTIS